MIIIIGWIARHKPHRLWTMSYKMPSLMTPSTFTLQRAVSCLMVIITNIAYKGLPLVPNPTVNPINYDVSRDLMFVHHAHKTSTRMHTRDVRPLLVLNLFDVPKKLERLPNPGIIPFKRKQINHHEGDGGQNNHVTTDVTKKKRTQPPHGSFCELGR